MNKKGKGVHIPESVMRKCGHRLSILMAMATMPDQERYIDQQFKDKYPDDKVWAIEQYKVLWNMELADRARAIHMVIKDLRRYT